MNGPTWSVGVLVESERELALEEFRRDARINCTLDELLALHVRQIIQTITHKRGGRTEIHTQVIGTKRQHDTQRFERYATRTPVGGG